MFKSLRGWLTVPIVIKPFDRRDGTGKPSFLDDVTTMCYPQGNITMVDDVNGNEVISKLQVYLDGNEELKITDVLVFRGEDHVIKSIGPVYDGNTGDVDMLVVYL